MKGVSRILHYDLLRSIGLVCIILAHVNPPGLLYQVRNFDVPLMVIVSGAIFGTIASNEVNFAEYFKRRVLRLLLPTYAFLIFFFTFFLAISSTTRVPYMFSASQIAESFALLGGIGYVWIVRVFLLAALSGPILLILRERLNSGAKYIAFLLICYGFYECGLRVGPSGNNSFIAIVVNEFLWSLIPYGCVFGIGMILPGLRKQWVLSIAGVSLFLFLICAVHYRADQFVLLSRFKYPPRLYYLSYGVGVASLLFSLFGYSQFRGSWVHVVGFLGSSSMWIYLWHIFILYLWQLSPPRMPGWGNQFIMELCIILLLSMTLTQVQKRTVKGLIDHFKIDGKVKMLLSVTFLK